MIVVTGGTGFLGSHIVRSLHKKRIPVRVLVRNIDRVKEEGRLDGLNPAYIEGDVTQPETLSNIFQDASAVIHTVAIAVEKGNLSYEEVNTKGTANILEASELSGVSRFINISQLGADSQLPYRFLASKGKAQELVVKSKLNWTTFKPSVIWGPEDEFANTFARLVKITPLFFPIIDKNTKFQPVWVEDVAEAVVRSLDDQSTNKKELELGGPEILSLYEIERRTLEAVGANRIFVPFPKSLLKIIVRVMENLLPSPPVTSSLLELLSVDNVTKSNAIDRFVSDPKRFIPEFTADYMKKFTVSGTIRTYLK